MEKIGIVPFLSGSLWEFIQEYMQCILIEDLDYMKEIKILYFSQIFMNEGIEDWE